jgi:hypothetical protein
MPRMAGKFLDPWLLIPDAAHVFADAIRRPPHGSRGPTEMEENMRKSLPEQMFADPEKSRLTMLRSWVLDQQVTEIDMNERQFWNFAALQPVAEKPWTTFMGRVITVSDVPQEAQKHLGI